MCNAYHMPHTGDLASNPGMCPNWEIEPVILGFAACAQSTELHQPGHKIHIFLVLSKCPF